MRTKRTAATAGSRVRDVSQKTINFGPLYEQLEGVRVELGFGNFSELIRHLCVRYLEQRREAAGRAA